MCRCSHVDPNDSRHPSSTIQHSTAERLEPAAGDRPAAPSTHSSAVKFRAGLTPSIMGNPAILPLLQNNSSPSALHLPSITHRLAKQRVVRQSSAHLDGRGQDVVVDDFLAQVLLLQQALQVEAVLGERRVDRLVVGQEQRDALRLVRQDVCAARTGSVCQAKSPA